MIWPGSTWKRDAVADAVEQGRFGRRHPHLSAPFEASEQGRAALRIEMGGDLVEQQDRRLAAALGDQSAWARTRPSSSAFCSPVEERAAGICLARWVTARSWRCGPSVARPAAASRARLALSAAARSPPSQPSSAIAARANSSSGASPSRSLERRDGPRARLGDRRAMLGHRQLERRPARRRPSARRRAACCARASPLRSARSGARGPAPARAPGGRGSAAGRPRCR